MEISAAYKAEKLNRPALRKSGEPRCFREEQLLKFKNKLNADRKEAGISELDDKRIATMFKGYPDGRLERLFNECSGAEKFGGLLKFKLGEFRNKA